MPFISTSPLLSASKVPSTAAQVRGEIKISSFAAISQSRAAVLMDVPEAV
jgi:hypothetical protein